MNIKNLRSMLVMVSMICALTMLSNCAKSPCTENIKEDCMCTMQYDPVCGCNNKTYGNACTAACSGITEFTKGECK